MGTQSPKSRPAIADFCTPPLLVAEEAAGEAEAGTVTVCSVVAAQAVAGSGSGVGVVVTVTVRMQEVDDPEIYLAIGFFIVRSDLPAGGSTAVALEATTAGLEAATLPAGAPLPGAVPELPAESFVVKLENPWAAMT